MFRAHRIHNCYAETGNYVDSQTGKDSLAGFLEDLSLW